MKKRKYEINTYLSSCPRLSRKMRNIISNCYEFLIINKMSLTKYHKSLQRQTCGDNFLKMMYRESETL